jgi:MFS-type transporter involved in bile tolerance (Atg22 family)
MDTPSKLKKIISDTISGMVSKNNEVGEPIPLRNPIFGTSNSGPINSDSPPHQIRCVPQQFSLDRRSLKTLLIALIAGLMGYIWSQNGFRNPITTSVIITMFALNILTFIFN